MTGRPKSFDRNALMAKSVELFWKQGYKITSVRDVASACGLTTGTLYNEFGGKEDLYAATVDHYVATIIYPRVKNILLSDTDRTINTATIDRPSKRIHYFLTSSIHGLPKSVAHQACLLVNSQIELNLAETQLVKRAINKGLKFIEKGLRFQLEIAESHNQLPHGVDAALLQINIFMTGLLLTAKSARQSAQLLPAVDQFIENTFAKQQ